MRGARLSISLLPIFLCAAFAQNATDRVIAEAQKTSALEANLQQLTDQIGGRVPGTPAMQKAVDWGVAGFKAAGADSVHTEAFSIQASWAEGATRMTVVEPEPFTLRTVSIAWAPPLALHSHVRIVDVGEGTAQDFAKVGDIAGAILLVHSEEMHTWDDLFAEYLKAPGVIDRAVKANALAIAFQSTRPHDLLYRHTNAGDGEIDRLPMVLVAREDAWRVARLLASGQKLYADLSIPNTIGGPVAAANLVAELRGSEKPDEYVILGAHLDSWDLGTGALDNGCNAALVIEALRAIKASGIKPKRTIQFILFSGEEEGLLGSLAYVHAHRADMDKYVAAVVFDTGTGKVTGFSIGGRKDMLNAANEIVEPLKAWDAATLTTDAEWGTDHFDFMLEGVPTFMANHKEANYLVNYHASSDTFDKVDFANLKRHVAEAAAVMVGLADRPERVGPRISRQEIERISHESGLEGQMRSADIWRDWESGARGRTP